MLAKLTDDVPLPGRVEGGLLYEPKWDGFRGIVYFDGTNVEIGSRGSKLLTRYFPELVAMFAQQLTSPCILDGEIVVRSGRPGAERLDWELLSQRIHPAASRVAKLADETPASFVAFDLLSIDGVSLLDTPFGERRAALEKLLATARPPLHLTQTSTDPAVANRWLEEFEGAGLDGVVAKPLAAAYGPGKRTMFKTKHDRTADVVLLGYRIHKSGSGVGSLLLGLYGEDGDLRNVGGASAFSDARRLQLVDELAPLVRHDESGDGRHGCHRPQPLLGLQGCLVRRPRTDPRDRGEVRPDGGRPLSTHGAVRALAPRPGCRSCTFDQLDRPIAYDLADVFA